MDRAYSSQIQRCESQLSDFLFQMLDVTGDFHRRTVPDKWSAQENLAHLARYHEIFLQRMDRILNEDRPVFSRYRAEEDPEWELWRQRTYRDLLDRLPMLREQLVLKLKSCLIKIFSAPVYTQNSANWSCHSGWSSSSSMKAIIFI